VLVDVSVASAWRIRCQEFFAGPVRAVFTFTQPVPDPGGAMYIREYLQDDAYARYILLDIGAGHNLLVEVTAPDQASWNEFTRAAMPIVNSFEFVR
jgi:hypothetical protein